MIPNPAPNRNVTAAQKQIEQKAFGRGRTHS